MVAPLTDLLKRKNRKTAIDWKEDYQKAFDELKGRLTENPVLYNPDFAKPFIIQCDVPQKGRRTCRFGERAQHERQVQLVPILID
ncbi:hypothetical protein TNCV_1524481 [Trichonephila clavipes]|nr:hypothetical protein TNCV_1524481 [Trichonephila clavipes]